MSTNKSIGNSNSNNEQNIVKCDDDGRKSNDNSNSNNEQNIIEYEDVVRKSNSNTNSNNEQNISKYMTTTGLRETTTATEQQATTRTRATTTTTAFTLVVRTVKSPITILHTHSSLPKLLSYYYRRLCPPFFYLAHLVLLSVGKKSLPDISPLFTEISHADKYQVNRRGTDVFLPKKNCCLLPTYYSLSSYLGAQTALAV